jgi:hypothetical protein
MTSDFRSVHELQSARIENAELFNNDAGLHACTDRKPQSAPTRVSAPPISPAGNTPTLGLCAQCHGEEGVAPRLRCGDGFPPDGVWLHDECARFWTDLSIPTFLARH